MIARLAAIAALVGGCGTIVGIDDHVPLTCNTLFVIGDHGQIDVTPPFDTSVTSYHVIVSSLTISVQVVVACDDPDATATANGLDVAADGTSPPIPLVHSTTDIVIAVTAPTDDPPPEIDFDVEVVR